jgi:AraC-like DNA-binding protein
MDRRNVLAGPPSNAEGACAVKRAEAVVGNTSEPGAGFLVDDFRVPLGYLAMVAGPDSAQTLLAQHGITASDLKDWKGYLSSVTFVRLCMEHFRTARSESLSHSSFIVPFGTFSLLVAAAAQAVSFGEALRRCSEAMEILRPDMIVRVGRGRNALRISIAYRYDATVETEVCIEFFALALQSAFRWLTGEQLRPIRAYAPAAHEKHEQSMLSVLRCPIVRCGTGVTFFYAPDAVSIPVRSLKYESWAAHELPEFLDLLQEAADDINRGITPAQLPIVERVSRLIAQGVRGELIIADRLGMSPASLRRHLASGGSSYRVISSEVQREMVGHLLTTEKTLCSIAEEVGFSEVRSLRRACLRWFGVTPAQYRNSAPQPGTVRNLRIFASRHRGPIRLKDHQAVDLPRLGLEVGAPSISRPMIR